jgi:hypothetical protein
LTTFFLPEEDSFFISYTPFTFISISYFHGLSERFESCLADLKKTKKETKKNRQGMSCSWLTLFFRYYLCIDSLVKWHTWRRLHLRRWDKQRFLSSHLFLILESSSTRKPSLIPFLFLPNTIHVAGG